MKYLMDCRIECWAKHLQEWDIATYEIPIAAVSRKHAIDKALKRLQSLGWVHGRTNNPDSWDVTVTARIIDELGPNANTANDPSKRRAI